MERGRGETSVRQDENKKLKDVTLTRMNSTEELRVALIRGGGGGSDGVCRMSRIYQLLRPKREEEVHESG
jgi:hypothetical protein